MFSIINILLYLQNKSKSKLKKNTKFKQSLINNYHDMLIKYNNIIYFKNIFLFIKYFINKKQIYSIEINNVDYILYRYLFVDINKILFIKKRRRINDNYFFCKEKQKQITNSYIYIKSIIYNNNNNITHIYIIFDFYKNINISYTIGLIYYNSEYIIYYNKYIDSEDNYNYFKFFNNYKLIF